MNRSPLSLARHRPRAYPFLVEPPSPDLQAGETTKAQTGKAPVLGDIPTLERTTLRTGASYYYSRAVLV